MNLDGLDLAAATASIRRAREFVGRCVGGHLEDQARSDLMLMVSELATNAVVHANTTFHVSCQVGQRIRVEISDLSLLMPTVDIGREVGGLGLRIIDQLSSDWGVRRTPAGKVVWLEVPTPGA
jgi:anti-sigma regulatory factor (Ser/Thr protein kinase)